MKKKNINKIEDFGKALNELKPGESLEINLSEAIRNFHDEDEELIDIDPDNEWFDDWFNDMSKEEE